LGSENVPGIDYAYNLQGWLKGINEGIAGEDAKPNDFPKDAFAMRLDYFDGDYQTSNTSALNTSVPGINSLYNGNIAAWTSHTPSIGADPFGQKYRYDALNRLKKAETFLGAPVTGAFNSEYQYDQGGNLLSLKRKDSVGTWMDDLTYKYKETGQPLLHNQLQLVTDAAGDEGMPTGVRNYQYDKDGRQKRDEKENLDTYWTLDNKLQKVEKGTKTTSYLYDASGNRVMKRLSGDSTECLMRDGSGNEVERIFASSGNQYKAEGLVYGSSRLGTAEIVLSGSDSVEQRSVGKYTYELTDHLGNVQ